MTTAAAVAAIDLYQQYISPHKGFCCAHRVRHGRPSCSQFAKRLISKVGWFRFAPLFMRRLKRCGDAAKALKASFAKRADAKRLDDADRKAARDEQKKRNGSWSDSCDPGSCDVGGCDPGVPNVSGCDVPSIDAGACDCASGCDFSI